MTSSVTIVVLTSLAAGALADYSTDLAYQNNYPYQDYNNYTYYSPQTSSRKRRVFTTHNPMTFSVTFEFEMPFPDLNTAVNIEVPFSFELPTAVTTSSGRSLSGSGSGLGSVRSAFYKKT